MMRVVQYILILICVAAIAYIIGFMNGQGSVYEKLRNQKSLIELYVPKEKK